MAKEAAEAINRFLETLDQQSRIMFVRRYWYSETVEDIAEFYGMNAKTVSTYLFRVRKKLKAFLQKEGYIDE